MRCVDRKIFIFGTLLLGVCSLFAQAPDTLWTRTFGGPDPDSSDSGSEVRVTSDSGYIIVGGTQSYGAGNGDIWLIKTDANGNETWTKTFGGSSSDVGYSVKQTFDRGYIITGWTQSYGVGQNDVYIVKTDATGGLVWQKAYGLNDLDGGNSVQQTSDSGYIVVGRVNPWEILDNMDVYLLRIKTDGDTLWTRTYGGDSVDAGESVQQTFDSGYIIAGYTNSFHMGGGDVYLVKIDADGDTLWTRTYGGSELDWGYYVEQTSDSGYIVVGKTLSFGSGESDIYLIRTDANGDTLWTRAYGGSNDEEGFSAHELSDNGYIVAGYTDSYGAGYADVYVIRTDANGDTIWTKTIGDEWSDQGRSLQVTPDTGYIITGYNFNLAGGFDVYLIKLAAESLGLQEGKTTGPSNLTLEIYPNPCRDKVRITYGSLLSILNPVELRIFNSIGQSIREFDCSASQQYIRILWDGKDNNGVDVSRGIYFLTLKTERSQEIRKLIVLR